MRQLQPAGVQVARLADDFALGQLRDLEHINLGLQCGHLVIECYLSCLEWFVLVRKAALVDRIRLVQRIELVDFRLQLPAFLFLNGK